MKAVSQTYKDNIKELGKEITYEITYDNTTLGDEDILNANLHYDGGMLKSVMKQLDIELYNDIPIGTELNYKFGIKVDDTNYEMVDYGNFIVYSSEKLEDSNTYKLVCYDKMLYAMKDYEAFATFPITIRDYINALCNHLGLTFANTNDDFTNYDKTIENELYIDNEGNNIGYTYRDVLDELAQATASTICINDNDELEIRYITNTNEEKASISGTSLSMTAHDNNVDIDLLGNTTQNGTPTPDNPQPIKTTTGRNVINVSGKNLFTTGNGTSSRIGVNATYNGSEVVLNGTTTSAGNIFYDETISLNTGYRKSQKLPAGTYTLSTKTTGTATYPSGVGIAIYIRDGSGTILKSFSSIANYQTTLTLNSETQIYSQMYINGSGGVYNNYSIHFQIEKGSTATTYEPYIGNSYEVNLGKNLLPSINSTRTINGITFTHNADGTISASGTATDNAIYMINVDGTSYTKNIELEAGTYIFSDGVGNYTDYLCQLTDRSSIYRNTGVDTTGIAPTLTLNQKTSLCAYVYIRNGRTINNIVFKPQIEKSSTVSSYSPYFEPIELCKIGTYQDRLFKASGKNLASNVFTDYDITDNSYAILPIQLEQGATYTLSATLVGEKKSQYYNYGIVKDGTNYQTFVSLSNCINYGDGTTSNKTFVVDSTYTNPKLVCFIQKSQTKFNELFTNYNIQLEKSSSATTYEPYGNYWYKYNAIGKVVLNGSESWYFTSNCCYTNNIVDVVKRPPNNTTKADIICDHYTLDTLANCYNNVNDKRISVNNGGYLYIYDTSFTSANAIKTWLSTNNTIVYYVLATPTYTKIENDELIGQLEHIRLINGYNNVISSSPITLNYVSGIDTIDEEYLKDINVNFGEMTKPINTITFKRSGDTDVISLSYPEDLEDDKKNEIAISENQILNYDNRDEYLKGILDRLYGLSYCLNDYTSTGITYYDLCDRYEVSITKTDVDGNVIDTNFYPCIMFNDEINVNQGLQEIVHTDRAEESITDYNTTTKTDRLKTRTDLIVNKQEGFIEAVTGSLQIGEDGQSEVVNGVVSRQTETESIINVITSFDENGNPTGVKTTKGFTFNEDGLNITSSDNTYKTQIDEQGTYYYDGDEILGQTTKEGSKFKDMELYGEFKYGKDEKDETAMFASMLYNDGTEECFGHFYNGREVE